MVETYQLNPHLNKTEATVEWITKRIDWQIYRPNQKVPSIRQLAKLLDISSFTVSQAYEQLVATNVLTAKQGSGYYVNNPIIEESKVENVNLSFPRISESAEKKTKSEQQIES